MRWPNVVLGAVSSAKNLIQDFLHSKRKAKMNLNILELPLFTTTVVRIAADKKYVML